MKVLCVVSARPNFMKIAPVLSAMKMHPDAFEPILVHTGQHYDKTMSDAFFGDLDLPEPDVNLGVGSGTHAQQTACIMTTFEATCQEQKPDLVLVVGDVNGTMASALVAAKLHIPVAHVEAGLRSGDHSMPEEVNRIVTDALSDFLFTTEHSGKENLLKEGIPDGKIHFVGNVMIDSLLSNLEKARSRSPWERFGFEPDGYGIVTLHRPSNIDVMPVFEGILQALAEIAVEVPLIFPVHPRTRRVLVEWSISKRLEDAGIVLTDPVGYIDFLGLIDKSRLILTDSGGLQEETTALGIPCLTIRSNTERPITISEGTNQLVGTDPNTIVEAAREVLLNDSRRPCTIERWDGKAAERIVVVLLPYASGL